MNQNTDICPLCSHDTKIVPPGVSKRTGKAYASFISCTSRDCKYTAQVPNPVPTIPDGTPTGTDVGTDVGIPPQPNSNHEEVMAALRTLWGKVDNLENKLVDKALQLEDLERKIDSFK